MYLAKGNRKLDKSILVWSLPAVRTCPDCEDCKQSCYARKSEIVYKDVLPCRTRNWEESLKSDFIDEMVAKIKRIQKNSKKHAPKAVRIHESGDFYSQEYAEKWAEIARQCPDLIFYGYTKVPGNLPERMPDNMNIVYSKINGEINFGNWNYVKAYAKKHRAKICPYGLTQKHFVCGRDCTACFRHSRIVFLKH